VQDRAVVDLRRFAMDPRLLWGGAAAVFSPWRRPQRQRQGHASQHLPILQRDAELRRFISGCSGCWSRTSLARRILWCWQGGEDQSALGHWRAGAWPSALAAFALALMVGGGSSDQSAARVDVDGHRWGRRQWSCRGARGVAGDADLGRFAVVLSVADDRAITGCGRADRTYLGICRQRTSGRPMPRVQNTADWGCC